MTRKQYAALIKERGAEGYPFPVVLWVESKMSMEKAKEAYNDGKKFAAWIAKGKV